MNDGSYVKYFAYGSNLNMGQMMNRVGEWATSQRAVAIGYKLIFNVQSKRWGGVAANLLQTNNPADKVYGAVYIILKEKLNVLSQYKCVPPQDLTVESEGNQITAKAYIFQTTRKPEMPPGAYLEVLLTGLKNHGYSEEIIDSVRRLAESQ